MKKLRLFILCLIVLPLTAAAQHYFGHISYTEVLHKMPEYEQVQKNMADLRAKYEAEAQLGESEFQKKFVDFLQGQKDFPQTILLKRQTELQSLMDNGVEFRKQMVSLLEKAESDLMKGVYAMLNKAIQEVGMEQKLICILNTDGNGVPFTNPEMGVDVTQKVLQKLGLAAAPEETVPAQTVTEPANTPETPQEQQ